MREDDILPESMSRTVGAEVVDIKDNKEINLAVRGVGRFKLLNQFSVSRS